MTAFEILQQKSMQKCQDTAKKMAALELGIYDDPNHQKELKQYYGFTDKKLAKRKIELIKAA